MKKYEASFIRIFFLKIFKTAIPRIFLYFQKYFQNVSNEY